MMTLNKFRTNMPQILGVMLHS